MNRTKIQSLPPQQKPELSYLAKTSSAIEYSFLDIGIFTAPFEWDGEGTFQYTINRTFDLATSGPVLLILDITADGDKPDSPGYVIEGEFNDVKFSSVVTRSRLTFYEIDNPLQQLVIPIKTEARVFANTIELNISCENVHSKYYSGSLQINGNSKLVVGTHLELESYGQYSSQIYPESMIGKVYLAGTIINCYIQIAITNETLLTNAINQLSLSLEHAGDISFTVMVYDLENHAFPTTINETSETTLLANAEFTPELGVNYYKIEFAVYALGLVPEQFNITIKDCQIKFGQIDDQFWFGNLHIPFFQWPSVPIVGVIVLFLWVMPYTILKYRDWRKMKDEVDFNMLEDEDDNLNFFDPEGIGANNEDDDFDNFEILEDD